MKWLFMWTGTFSFVINSHVCCKYTFKPLNVSIPLVCLISTFSNVYLCHIFMATNFSLTEHIALLRCFHKKCAHSLQWPSCLLRLILFITAHCNVNYVIISTCNGILTISSYRCNVTPIFFVNMDEIKVTITHIVTVKLSNMNPQSTCKTSELIQVFNLI